MVARFQTSPDDAELMRQVRRLSGSAAAIARGQQPDPAIARHDLIMLAANRVLLRVRQLMRESPGPLPEPIIEEIVSALRKAGR